MEHRDRELGYFTSEYEMARGDRTLLDIIDEYPSSSKKVLDYIRDNTLADLYGYEEITSVPLIEHYIVVDQLCSNSKSTILHIRVNGVDAIAKLTYSTLIARELAVLTVAHHRNIITPIGYGRGVLFEELCEGSIDSGLYGMSKSEVVSQTILGIKYLHSIRVLHGDIRPENVLIARGVVKIADCGLSELGIPRSVCCFKYVRNYRPPEITALYLYDKIGISGDRMREVLDHTPDIYALGLLIYFIVTGVDLIPRNLSSKYVLGGQYEIDTVGFDECNNKWGKYYSAVHRSCYSFGRIECPGYEKVVLAMLRNDPSKRSY